MSVFVDQIFELLGNESDSINYTVEFEQTIIAEKLY